MHTLMILLLDGFVVLCVLLSVRVTTKHFIVSQGCFHFLLSYSLLFDCHSIKSRITFNTCVYILIFLSLVYHPLSHNTQVTFYKAMRSILGVVHVTDIDQQYCKLLKYLILYSSIPSACRIAIT